MNNRKEEGKMIFPCDLTDNDSDAQIFNIMGISPSYSTMLVEPPRNETAFYNVLDTVYPNSFGYKLVSVPLESTISQEVHETLLARSLVEFEDIWRSLARK
jgi:hypothetical protein